MSIASWLTSSISVASVTGSPDAFGKPTYGSPVAVAARIEQQRTLVRKSNGEEAVANHVIYTSTAIALTDRIWLPGANTSLADQSNLPATVVSTPDKSGARTLYKVML